jgi:pimeloyl-ACP methyl ester carboxylesterase
VNISNVLLAAAACLAAGALASSAGEAAPPGAVKSIVLIHGGFVDGSGWKGVHQILKSRGYSVTVVQNSTESFERDVAITRRAIAAAEGRVILVAHSYGGAVMSEAGTDPKVAGLVYVAGFAPDKGESVASLIGKPAPDAPPSAILPPQDGYLSIDRAKFASAFAADVDPDLAQFMADSQVLFGLGALSGAVTKPAWRAKPSWYVVTTEDRTLPPAAQRHMAKRAGSTVVELAGSHAIYVSRPADVAAAIERAAQGVGN